MAPPGNPQFYHSPPGRIAGIADSLSIVHIDTARTFRGGQEALLTLARALRARGHVQRIVTPAGSALSRRASETGLEVSAPEAFSRWQSRVRCLRSLMQGFQIVHTHSGRAQNLAFLASLRLPVVRVTTRHVAFEPRRPAVHRLKYTLTCHGIIAVSQDVRRVLTGAGVPADKIEVIPDGVETPGAPATPAERCAARKEFGFADTHFVVGHLGAFTPEKGQDVAVEAARLLAQRMPELRMILAGEGPLRVASSERVLVPGFLSNRAEFFAALDLFLMPSRSEGFGLAAAEALARGVPVVASDTGGLSEIVEPGETGWLVPPGDPQALAEAIALAASDPENLRAMGAKARERAKRYSVEQTAELTESFYRRLLARLA